MKKILILLTACLLFTQSYAQEKKSEVKRFIKTSTGYLMVLREGDDVFKAITQLAKTENIPSANFYGMGFAGSVTFGFYDFNKKVFNPKEFKRAEMGSVTGSIAWSKEQPSLHIHGIATDEEFKAYGGHVLAMVVGTGSLEITITVHQQKLERKVEQPLNANVLQLE